MKTKILDLITFSEEIHVKSFIDDSNCIISSEGNKSLKKDGIEYVVSSCEGVHLRTKYFYIAKNDYNTT